MLVAIAADIVAVRRAYMAGREIALAEVRRRWPECSDRALPELLDQILMLPAVRTRASLARSSIVIHVGIPAGQIGSLPVIRFIPGLIRTPARPSMALDHRVAM